MRLSTCAVLALLLCSSGCGMSEGSPSAPVPQAVEPAVLSYGPAVPGLDAQAYQTRVDEAVGARFQITVTNTSSVEFTVVGTGLDSPGFAPLPQSPRETVFRPGARYDLPTPYGTAMCQADVPAEPAYAVLDVLRPDGTREQLRAPLPSVAEVLTRIHDRECRAADVAAAVTVSLVDLVAVGEGPEQVVSGRLQLTRAAAQGPLAVTGLRGSVLYEVVPGLAFPVELASADDVVSLPVELSPRTCEAHTIAETKQPFLFPLFISFDGAEASYSEIPVSQDQRDLLFGSVQEVCGL